MNIKEQPERTPVEQLSSREVVEKSYLPELAEDSLLLNSVEETALKFVFEKYPNLMGLVSKIRVVNEPKSFRQGSWHVDAFEVNRASELGGGEDLNTFTKGELNFIASDVVSTLVHEATHEMQMREFKQRKLDRDVGKPLKERSKLTATLEGFPEEFGSLAQQRFLKMHPEDEGS